MLPNGIIILRFCDRTGTDTLRGESMKEVEDFFIDKPALSVFPTDDGRMTDMDYLRMSLGIKVKCNIEMNREESDDNYKTNIYLKGEAIEGMMVDNLMHFLRASDLYTFTVLKRNPQVIRLTCYRRKREKTLR